MQEFIGTIEALTEWTPSPQGHRTVLLKVKPEKGKTLEMQLLPQRVKVKPRADWIGRKARIVHTRNVVVEMTLEVMPM